MSIRSLLAWAAAFAVLLTAACNTLPSLPAALVAPADPDRTPPDWPYAQGKTLGPRDAPVVIEEYADFQCPWCAKFATGALHDLEDTYIRPGTGQVRFIFRHMAVLGPASQTAAEAAECANEQGQFWPYADQLYANQRTPDLFSPNGLKQLAADIGLDTAAFNACLDSRRYQQVVEQETRQGQARGVRYTPTFIVNGQVLVGAVSLAQLSRLIASGSGD